MLLNIPQNISAYIAPTRALSVPQEALNPSDDLLLMFFTTSFRKWVNS